ncbi:GTPase [Pseudoduganella eburnea]|uniref:GTPase n=1 Tax=Massilia eburnea TaxID=1776165 RepID=A0A6L6QJ02_9BURK|nr:GTPase [Massilia eburnea]MTW12239.1 GTPase [Massilia eburnea]
MTPTTLVIGPTAAARESAIAAVLSPGVATAIILEGLADANSSLVYDESDPPAWQPQVHRIAPGCLCCAGNLVLRVTLNRLLRRPPAQLFISLADATHVESLRAMLETAPYDALLRLEPVLNA